MCRCPRAREVAWAKPVRKTVGRRLHANWRWRPSIWVDFGSAGCRPGLALPLARRSGAVRVIQPGTSPSGRAAPNLRIAGRSEAASPGCVSQFQCNGRAGCSLLERALPAGDRVQTTNPWRCADQHLALCGEPEPLSWLARCGERNAVLRSRDSAALAPDPPLVLICWGRMEPGCCCGEVAPTVAPGRLIPADGEFRTGGAAALRVPCRQSYPPPASGKLRIEALPVYEVSLIEASKSCAIQSIRTAP